MSIRNAEEQGLFKTLLLAIAGFPGALRSVFSTNPAGEFGSFYTLEEEGSVPIVISTEGVWTDFYTTPEGTPAKGKYAIDYAARWSLNSAQSRITAVRVGFNGVFGEVLRAETAKPDEIAQASTFTDFEIDGLTPLSVTVQGQLESGGGAADMTLISSRFRLYLITSETAGDAQIIVT